MTTTIWEYETIILQAGFRPAEGDNGLYDLGRQGWEAVGITPLNYDAIGGYVTQYQILMKRPYVGPDRIWPKPPTKIVVTAMDGTRTEYPITVTIDTIRGVVVDADGVVLGRVSAGAKVSYE